MLLTSLIVALLADSLTAGRGRVHELRGRLGLQERQAVTDPVVKRLIWVLRSYGDAVFWVVYAWTLRGSRNTRPFTAMETKILDADLARSQEDGGHGGIIGLVAEGVAVDPAMGKLIPFLARLVVDRQRDVCRLMGADPGQWRDTVQHLLQEALASPELEHIAHERRAIAWAERELESMLSSRRNLDPAPIRLYPRLRRPEVLSDVLDWYVAVEPDLASMTWADVVEAEQDWNASRGGLAKGAARHGDVVKRWDDGWSVHRLTSRKELEDEGKAMSHCVGGYSYWSDVQAGRIAIYSLRDADGDPVATWEVALDLGDPSQVRQIKGHNNDVAAEWGDDVAVDHAFEFTSELLGRDDFSSAWGSDGFSLWLANLRLRGASGDLGEMFDDISDRLRCDTREGQSIYDAMKEEADEGGGEAFFEAWAASAEKGEISWLPPRVASIQGYSVVEPYHRDDDGRWVHDPPKISGAFDYSTRDHWREAGFERNDDLDDIPVLWTVAEEWLQSRTVPRLMLHVRLQMIIYYEHEYYYDDGSWKGGYLIEALIEDTRDWSVVAKSNHWDWLERPFDVFESRKYGWASREWLYLDKDSIKRFMGEADHDDSDVSLTSLIANLIEDLEDPFYRLDMTDGSGRSIPQKELDELFDGESLFRPWFRDGLLRRPWYQAAERARSRGEQLWLFPQLRPPESGESGWAEQMHAPWR